MDQEIIIKVLLDQNRRPFIPYVPSTAIFLKDEHGEATSVQAYLLRALQDRLTPSNLGEQLKTINNETLVGSGNIEVAAAAEWGNIGGTLTNQADLISILNDKASVDYVNNSIATNTAYFRGTSAPGLTEQQFLAWADTLTKTNNDYCLWMTTDAAGNILFKRYKYNGTDWLYEYTFESTEFTSTQMDAINSGINATKVATYDGYASGKQNTLTAGTGISINNNTISASIVNNLTSTSTSSALSAKQGKELKTLIDTLTTTVNDKTKVYSGTSVPSASTGSNGDLYIQTAS